MPEGDTIRRLAARIESGFAGATVARSRFRTPRLATLDLAGHVLTGTGSHGKNLFVRFDDGSSLAVHLLMQGRVLFGNARAEPWRRRFELDFATPPGGRITGLDIPKLERIRTEREPDFTAHLGPDVCGVYDPEEGRARLRSVPELPLGGALLNQRVIAGLGNIYAVETPFITGLDPRTPVGEIEDPDPVLDLAVALIRTNAWLGPQNTTGRRMRDSDHFVISTGIRGCPVCGERVTRLDEHDTAWGRRTSICPVCQDPGHRRADVERAARLTALHPARRLLDPASARIVTDTDAPVEVRLRR